MTQTQTQKAARCPPISALNLNHVSVSSSPRGSSVPCLLHITLLLRYGFGRAHMHSLLVLSRDNLVRSRVRFYALLLW